MVAGRTRVLGCGLAVAALLTACSRGAAAGRASDDPVVSAGPSTVSTGPAPGASLPSGLPSDPGAADPVTTVPAGGALPADVASGDLGAVVFAAGVLQYLHCAGTGAPTVVVVPGLGVPHTEWSAQVEALAQHSRTCVYDRPGVSLSPPRTSPLQVVDAGLNARELATLLSVAKQPAPYAVVGQGYGTLVARAFVRLFPGSVRSLVLAGSAPPAAAGQVFWTEAGHRVDIGASTRAAGRTPTGSPALDVVVLRSDDPTEIAAAVPPPSRS
jgi:pimeloyl-ACP methyl ester carboxylesterase